MSTPVSTPAAPSTKKGIPRILWVLIGVVIIYLLVAYGNKWPPFSNNVSVVTDASPIDSIVITPVVTPSPVAPADGNQQLATAPAPVDSTNVDTVAVVQPINRALGKVVVINTVDSGNRTTSRLMIVKTTDGILDTVPVSSYERWQYMSDTNIRGVSITDDRKIEFVGPINRPRKSHHKGATKKEKIVATRPNAHAVVRAEKPNARAVRRNEKE